MEYKREWPFGKPSTEPGAYSGDRQTRESDALRPYNAAEAKFTATGRLKKGADPAVVRRNLEDCIAKFRALIEEAPDHTAYPVWLANAERLLTKVK